MFRGCSPCLAKVFQNKKKDSVLEIDGNRYWKVNKDKSTRFTTRLVSKGGIYSCHPGKENDKILEKAGFVEHGNCIPLLARSKDSHTSKANAEFKNNGVLEINIFNRKQDKKVQEEQFREKHAEEFKKIEEKRKPMCLELQNEKQKRDKIKECKLMFCGEETGKLGDLKQGKYIVKAAKKEYTWFGKTYKLLIHEKENEYIFIVWSNIKITDKLEKTENSNTVDLADNFLYIHHDNLGMLEITGYGYTPNRNKMVYCKLTLNTRKDEEKKIVPVKENETVTPLIPRENLNPYKDYLNLIALPIGSVHNVDGWGFIKHYGTDRLVVSVDGKIYQAGDNLEENVNQLKIFAS